MSGPTLVRGFAPGGIGPRDISNSDNISGERLSAARPIIGGSAEVQFPIFGLPKEIGLRGAVFADAGNLIGYSGQTNFSNFLGYTYCPPLDTVAHHAAELRQRLGPESHPRLGRREPDLGLADGTDPLRLRASGLKGKYDQTQYLQLLGRHDLLDPDRPAFDRQRARLAVGRARCRIQS